MKWRAVHLTLVACLFSTAGALNAQQIVELSLEEAIEIARENNPSFLAVLNDMGPAQWGVRAANANLFLPDAAIGFSASWQDAGIDRVGGATFPQPSVLISNYSFSLTYALNGTTIFSPG